MTLLQGERFEEHHRSLPKDVLQSTLKVLPNAEWNQAKELGLIYSKEEFRGCGSTVDLFQLFIEINLDLFRNCLFKNSQFRNCQSIKDHIHHTNDHSRT